MPVAIGARSLIDNAIPTGVDGAVLFERGLEDGLSTMEVLQLSATLIGEENERLEQEYSGLVTFTNRDYSRYRQGEAGRQPTPLESEFSDEHGTRASKIGHMLPRNDFHDVLAFTKLYFKRGNREDVRDDILVKRDSWRDRVALDIMTRLLTNTEIPIGTSGYSPGFAIGTGTNVNFIPPKNGNITFDSTHTQYLRVNGAIGASNCEIAINAAARLLARLGHTGRKVVLVSAADVSHYAGMDDTKFVRFIPGQFQALAGATDRTIIQGELMGIPGEIFGYWISEYGVVELRYHERIPTTYFYMGKSYGVNANENPLAVRIDPQGFGLMVDPEIRWGTQPRLAKIDFDATHGVGVNDRTNGVVYQIAAGSATFSNPTIT